MEIVGGKIIRMDEDGSVLICAGLPSIDRAALRKYDKVLVGLPDGRRISPEQRRKCYAMLNEISEWSGELPERMKQIMKIDFCVNRLQAIGSKMFSLSDVDVTTAREFIDYLINFMLENGVPSRVPLYELCDDVRRYVYACLMNKACAVCGRKADVHHLSGSRAGHGGLAWREKDQTGAKVLPLCREHHRIIHDGEKEFLEKYHLEGIQMTKEIARLYKAKMKDEVKQ